MVKKSEPWNASPKPDEGMKKTSKSMIRKRLPSRPLLKTPGGQRRGFRLVGRPGPSATHKRLNRNTALNQPITGPSDPRWVLAVRTAEKLQGAILTPQRRKELARLGKLLGLTPFSVSLVIAVVQDQARRGRAPVDCPKAGQQQLRMVPLPDSDMGKINPVRTALAIAALLSIELILIGWWILT